MEHHRHVGALHNEADHALLGGMEYESAHLSDAPVRVLFFLMSDEHLLVQELADAQQGFLGHETSIRKEASYSALSSAAPFTASTAS